MIIRESQSYYINSRNRTSGSDDSDVTVSIHLSTGSKYNRVVLTQATIPKNYYLVDTPWNSFILEEKGVQVEITIPPGNYSRTSFQIIIEELLNTYSPSGWTYDVTYPNSRTEADTGKYTYAVSGTGVGENPKFIFTGGLYEQMGFLVNSTNEFSADVLISVAVLKFQLEDAVYMRSSMCSTERDNVLAAIYMVNTPQFSTYTYRALDTITASKPLSTQNSTSFRFWITDEDGHTINLNNSNWNAEITVMWVEPITIPSSVSINNLPATTPAAPTTATTTDTAATPATATNVVQMDPNNIPVAAVGVEDGEDSGDNSNSLTYFTDLKPRGPNDKPEPPINMRHEPILDPILDVPDLTEPNTENIDSATTELIPPPTDNVKNVEAPPTII